MGDDFYDDDFYDNEDSKYLPEYYEFGLFDDGEGELDGKPVKW